MHDLSDFELLKQLAAREADQEAAMRILFNRHLPRLVQHLRFAFNLSEAATEDIAAQAFLNMYEHAAGFRGDCQVSSWLIGIARHLAIDRQRKEALRKKVHVEMDAAEDEAFFCALSTEEDGDMLYESLLEKRMQECVMERFQRFRHRHPEAATALWERHANERSIEEIAAMLGRKYGAACQFLSEWRGRLRQFLEPCYALLNRRVP